LLYGECPHMALSGHCDERCLGPLLTQTGQLEREMTRSNWSIIRQRRATQCKDRTLGVAIAEKLDRRSENIHPMSTRTTNG